MADLHNKPVTGTTNPPATPKTGGGLGVLALASIVVSSMIGGGIYSLPQNMAAGASAGAVLLAWIITGIGVYFIANTFRILSAAKPDLTAGVWFNLYNNMWNTNFPLWYDEDARFRFVVYPVL